MSDDCTPGKSLYRYSYSQLVQGLFNSSTLAKTSGTVAPCRRSRHLEGRIRRGEPLRGSILVYAVIIQHVYIVYDVRRLS